MVQVLFASLSVVIGLCQVAQAGVNRYISKHIGLPLACVLNNVLGATCAAGMYMLERSAEREALPDAFENKGSFADFRLWWLLPAVFGFCIVVMIPWGIARMGAFRMFATMIAAELVFSLGWDALFEGRPVGLVRGATAAVVGIGAALVFGADALMRRFGGGGGGGGGGAKLPPTKAPEPGTAAPEEAGDDDGSRGIALTNREQQITVKPNAAAVVGGPPPPPPPPPAASEDAHSAINSAPSSSSSSGGGGGAAAPASGWAMDLLPIFIGFCRVGQGTTNRLVAKAWGLPKTAMLSMGAFLVLGFALLWACARWPERFDPIFTSREAYAGNRWWYALPALSGFIVVFGLPWTIANIGALVVFTFLILTEITASFLWDLLVERMPVNRFRVAGLLTVVAGVVVQQTVHSAD